MNLVFSLATWAGKIGPSCIGPTRKKFSFWHNKSINEQAWGQDGWIYRKRPNKRPGRLLNFFGSKWGRLIHTRRLKEKGVYTHNSNKLNKTNMLSAKISREFKNSGISTSSKFVNNNNTSGPSRDPYCSFNWNSNIDIRILAQGYCVAIFSLTLLWTWH